jgi:hypothetical protein
MQAVGLAKDQAARMFGRIGIRLEWRSTGRAPLASTAILVDIIEHASPNECGQALACARPYEGVHIRVFYDRLQATVFKSVVPALLAHVLVHEITHILQGSNRHADRGVMKETWDAPDFAKMRSPGLPFTEADVVLIERGWAARGSGRLPFPLDSAAADPLR